MRVHSPNKGANLSLLKRLNICDLESKSNKNEEDFKEEEHPYSYQEDADDEEYDHASALFDDDSIP